MKPFTALAILICLLFLLPCGAETIVHPAAPIENTFIPTNNDGPGIYVKLRMENGKELLFLVDTGRPHTSFDKSLEPLLGKRLGHTLFFEPLVDGLTFADVYKAPKLYLGDTPLVTDSRICAYDWRRYYPGMMGVLGMDCLRHYCVQFDFAQNKIRFLDPDHLDSSNLGTRFPLTIIFGLVIARGDCFGAGNMLFCPDTGDTTFDATIKPSLFRRKLKERPFWTYNMPLPNGDSTELAGFTNCIFAGQSYTHLTFNRWYSPWPDGDLIGLPFLARHLVTFNFPKRMMYLKQETSVPRLEDDFQAVEAVNYFQSLGDKNELPGLSTNDCASGGFKPTTAFPTNFPITVTFTLKKSPVPHWIDLTPRIQSLVANGARFIRADNAMAGCDPAHGYSKKLRIDYSVGKIRRMAVVTEGQTIYLPAGAQIIRVHYGYPYGTRLDPLHPDPPIDDSQYIYTLVEKSLDGPWQLQKAARADKKGHVVEQYHLETQISDSIGAR
ncbi:MAG TPA: hypothetical protein VMF08_23195 [Candidatus Sulfotelmatobacter sp.]|nr:hypothetical protein [Candidatus Sulfotelmatobacter sp.]